MVSNLECNDFEQNGTLRTLTPLNKESRPFFLGDSSIWSFTSVSSLSNYSVGVPEGYLSLAIIAIEASESIIPEYYYRLGKRRRGGLRSSRCFQGIWGRVSGSKFFRRSHSAFQNVVQGKCPLHFLQFNGAICSNTLFSNTFALTSSLLFRADSTCKGSRTPRFVERFWVPILGVSCSNKLFVGTLRPSHFFQGISAFGGSGSLCSVCCFANLRSLFRRQYPFLDAPSPGLFLARFHLLR